jgi:hypothetical protein
LLQRAPATVCGAHNVAVIDITRSTVQRGRASRRVALYLGGGLPGPVPDGLVGADGPELPVVVLLPGLVAPVLVVPSRVPLAVPALGVVPDE